MKIIGHRGAKGLAPENTLTSFEKALEYKVAGIELDVHLTKDHVLVCCHDPVLTMADGTRLPVAQYTYAELKERKSDLATLPEAIQMINRRVPIVIEIKEPNATNPTIKCVRGFLTKGWQMSDFEFCSFLQPPLIKLRAAFPDAELIVNQHWSSVWACWRARQINTKRISMRQKWLWRGYLRGMQRGGWKVSAYTVNSPARARKWAPYLYTLYTDYPDRMLHL